MWSTVMLAVGLGACGRLGFSTASADAGSAGDGHAIGRDGSTCPGTICDDFARTTLIPTGDPRWMTTHETAPGCTLSVDGSFRVGFSSVTNPGSIECQLISQPLGSMTSVEVDFDITLAQDDVSTASMFVVNPAVVLATPNQAGIQQEFLQLGVSGDGRAGIALVQYYPDPTKSPDGTTYPGWSVADSNGLPWLALGQPCHIALTMDAVANTATATASCSGGPGTTLTQRTPTIPTGISGPFVLSFGYSNYLNSTGNGTAVYDNLVATITP